MSKVEKKFSYNNDKIKKQKIIPSSDFDYNNDEHLRKGFINNIEVMKSRLNELKLKVYKVDTNQSLVDLIIFGSSVLELCANMVSPDLRDGLMNEIVDGMNARIFHPDVLIDE